MWDLYLQFDGAKFVHKQMCRSDVRYLNLLSIIEAEGYGLSDSLYFVKHEGEGLNGLEQIDSNLKVEEMIRKYESSRKVVLTVMKDKRSRAIVVSPGKKPPPMHIDLEAAPQNKRKRPIHVDLEAEEGEPLSYQISSQHSVYFKNVHTEMDEHIPSQFPTQESVFCHSKQAEEEEFLMEENGEGSADDSWA